MKPNEIQARLEHEAFILWLLARVPAFSAVELKARADAYQQRDPVAARICRDELQRRLPGGGMYSEVEA